MSTAIDVLNCPMDPTVNDAEASTVRSYLCALVKSLWTEAEGFSSKRPFGNSGWQDEVYYALVRGGVVPGTIDEKFGELANFNERATDKLILDAIDLLAEAAP